MKSTIPSNLHGFASSRIDSEVRLSLSSGSVVAFAVSAEGVRARMGTQPLSVSATIDQARDVQQLAAILMRSPVRVKASCVYLHGVDPPPADAETSPALPDDLISEFQPYFEDEGGVP
jgi:hypothetical protein